MITIKKSIYCLYIYQIMFVYHTPVMYHAISTKCTGLLKTLENRKAPQSVNTK